MNVLNQHLHVHQAPTTDTRLIEAVAEERHRHAMDRQGEQLQLVSTQRDEMRAQGLRFMNEAEQMFHENEVAKQEASAFVEAANKGYGASSVLAPSNKARSPYLAASLLLVTRPGAPGSFLVASNEPRRSP